ncbi:MAG: hypothetical protein M9949_04610 [Candidatus Kapabacteria bacterium]|nr:hypothetical protein [Candidatus Kapabacteria bacterium]
MKLGNHLDVNNHELRNALLEKVTSLPTGLTEDHAGRVVRLGSGLYMWVGWRWVGLSDNKFHFKPSDQIVLNDNNWYDDNNIEFEIGKEELYSFEFYLFPEPGPLPNGVNYKFKFTPSVPITEMYGTHARYFYYPLAPGSDWLGYNVNLLNEIEVPALDDEDPPVSKIWFGILYGGSATSTIKLQHKVTSLAGNAVIKATSRIILTRIY